MAGRTELEFSFGKGKGKSRRRAEPGEDVSFRIVVLGEFGGAAPGKLASARLQPIDIDTFDQVLAKLGPGFELGAGGPPVSFSTLEDFHPDRLFTRLPAFAALRELRRRLLDPTTSRETIDSFSRALQQQQDTPALDPVAASAGAAAPTEGEGEADTLSRLLGRAPSGGGPGRAAAVAGDATAALDALFKQAVAGQVVPSAHPDQKRLLAALDGAIGQHLRNLLHDPAFKRIEAAWRGLHWLVSGLELGETLRVFLIDVGLEEAAADLAAAAEAGDAGRSRIHRLLTGGEEPDPQVWSALVGLYTFGAGAAHTAALRGFAALGEALAAPFLAAASPSVLGCPSFATAPAPGDWKTPDGDSQARWRALRQHPSAPWLGLVMPRFLLRLPYGAKADPIDSFPFEEQGGGAPEHEDYLWANPALAAARVIGELYLADGTAMQPGTAAQIDDLPLHSYPHDGESRLLAPSEAFLGETAVEAIMDRGVMPLVSLRRQSTVKLARFQSLAEPPTPLAGPWEE
jgi:type VI secretion system protein ImpC